MSDIFRKPPVGSSSLPVGSEKRRPQGASTGVIIATYQRAGAVKYGSFAPDEEAPAAEAASRHPLPTEHGADRTVAPAMTRSMSSARFH